MTQSMTGFGRCESLSGDIKIISEIRSVNGKSSDVSIKSNFLPKERENDIKSLISRKLIRGNIDLFLNYEAQGQSLGKNINREVFSSYLNQLRVLKESLKIELTDNEIFKTIIKLPDVIESGQKLEIDEILWTAILDSVSKSIENLIEFRITEGKILEEEILNRVESIEKGVTEIESLDKQRIEGVRSKLMSRLDELNISLNTERLEQELIYYIEKLDITEEKVRLIQHCNYFKSTISEDDFSGRKLSFIAQEMGREINTLGSKANHASIQKLVVQMKDDLEKIKEQALNIL